MSDQSSQSSQSSQVSLRYSEEFPQGNGDFSLISSDGVVFTISRFLLSHVSPVFEDMLDLGTASSSQAAELQVTEDSETLDQLLRFFDPLKDPAPITLDTIEKFLEAARKYQVERVFKYWEEKMIVRDESNQVVKISAPLTCLALADYFGRREMLRLALREL
ncbi:hypothetical protein FRC17_008665, partial [Serendipita sp. 399]